MKKIDEAQDDHRTGKEAGSEEEKTQRILAVEEQETQGGQEFNQWIGERNFSLAVPALPSQDQVGNDGDVVVDFDLLPAGRTGRSGFDDAHIPGNAVDQDIEETSPGEAKNDNDDYLFHGIVEGLTSPVWESYRYSLSSMSFGMESRNPAETSRLKSAG